METGKLLVISLVCLSAYGLPSLLSYSDSNSPIIGNTIFAEERFAGEIFEDIDANSNVTFSPRNEVSPYRLPTTTKPVHYDVLWIIDLARTLPTQSGTVQIQLQATQANVNEIVIHSDGLTLSSVQLLQNTNPILITSEEDATYQFLRVRLSSGFLAFNAETPVIYTLRIEFSAFLRDDMYGIYKTWYRNSATDEVRWMASTQFQATAARWAFPCYDEPSFKATFDITIRRLNTYKSWSCTRLKETKAVANAPTFQDDVYHTTPIMSTYLLALIVSEYDSLSTANTQGQLLFEVIARPGAISAGQGDYVLDVGQRLLNKMSEHTDIDFYTQDVNLKMTQAAIPDFGAGAMENWGLLTYREAYLMYDKSETNSYFKQMIAYTVSHEIAHMWFGNLVTCDWWDVTWLNEGFARYYQYHLTFWVEGMGLETRFIPEQVHTSLLSDSSNNPQPLTNPNRNSNSAVSNMFSTITYNKGAAVIRMTEHLLGSEVHVTGLRTYLKDRSYKTGLPIQLFEHLEKAGKDEGVLNYGPEFSFIEYFKSWTENPGHPVLNVHVNHQTGVMTVSQRRFNINIGYSNIVTNYIVPITFATASNPHFHETKPSHILTTQEATIDRGTTGDEWVIFNNQQTGFYRVNYDDYTWDLIAIALKSYDMTLIHENNRAQIVNDLFQFARSGLMDYSRALNILSYLEQETDYAPWVAAVTGFNWLRQRLAGDTTAVELALLNDRIAQWASKVMELLTYYPSEDETFMHSYLRYQLAPLMCNLGEIACLQAAKTQFEALRTSNTPVPVDSRHWVYCNGLRQGNAEDFNFLWNRFQNFNVYTEKILILQNIGCTKDAASLQTFMRAIVLDNYIIRPQDYNTAFSSAVNGNEENTEIAFNFIRDNLELVARGFKGSVATPMSYVTARLRSEERINQFIVWADANEQALGSAYGSVVSGAELTRDSIVWAETRRKEIHDYLADPPTTSTTATDAPGQSTDNPESTNTGQYTVTPSPITEPVTPLLPSTPGFATKNYVETITMIVAMVVSFVL